MWKNILDAMRLTINEVSPSIPPAMIVNFCHILPDIAAVTEAWNLSFTSKE